MKLKIASVVAALLLGSRAEAQGCAVLSIPATISAPGCYKLDKQWNISAVPPSGAAILVTSGDVTIDLGEYRLGAGAQTSAYGIYGLNVSSVHVKASGGSLKRFKKGIFFERTTGPSRGHVIDGVRFDQGLEGAIELQSDQSTIRNVTIASAGVLLSYMGDETEGAGDTFGIKVSGDGNAIVGNSVNYIESADAVAYGILVAGGCALVDGNRISDADVGIAFTGTASGKYRNNLTAAVATAFVGGTDVGGNN